MVWVMVPWALLIMVTDACFILRACGTFLHVLGASCAVWQCGLYHLSCMCVLYVPRTFSSLMMYSNHRGHCMPVTGIPKLDDANEAGGRNSQHCTLILTEGDSAKTLALSGLSVVGRDYYGVFPLRCAQVHALVSLPARFIICSQSMQRWLLQQVPNHAHRTD